MRNSRDHINRHLRVEQLELRSMLAAVAIASGPVVTTTLEGNSALVGGGFPSDAAAMGNAAAVGTANLTNPNAASLQVLSQVAISLSGGQPGVGLPGIGVSSAANVGFAVNASGPDATSGVGQMTITTGANTLGISSFASPIAGFKSATIGTGYLMKQPGGDDLDSLFE